MKEEALWMQKIKEKLSDYAEPVPASGWERLEKDLAPPVRNKLIPYWRWTAAAAVLLAVVSSVSFYFLEWPVNTAWSEMQEMTLTDEGVFLSVGSEETFEQAAVVASEGDKDLLAHCREMFPVSEHSKKKPVLLSVVDEAELAKTVGQEDSLAGNQTVGVVQYPEEQTVISEKKVHRPSDRSKFHLPVDVGSDHRRRWSVGLSVAHAGGALAQVEAPMYMSRVSMFDVTNGWMDIPADQTLVFDDGVPYLCRKNRILDIKHHQPLTFGVTFRRDLSKGFSLETGMTYTLLSSDVRLEGKGQEIEQKLHYMGIPLRVNWNFYDKKWLTTYLSAGGSMEKCIYGKLGSEKQTVKPLQFSVSGAVGAQINASKHIGLYLEPGVAYFFKDGSGVQTIRKENPLQFTLQAGVRFTY